MDDDLGRLQREIWEAVQKAAASGDGSVLSVLGPITGDMKRKYYEWADQFRRVSLQIDPTQYVPQNVTVSGQTRGEDFTGKAIRGFEFGGIKSVVGTYKEMLLSLSEQLISKHGDTFDTVVARVRGQKPYFSNRREDLREPRELKPGLHVETNFPANQAVKVCRDLLEAFGYPAASLHLDVVPFRTRAVKRTIRSQRAQQHPRGLAMAPQDDEQGFDG